ncbi:hypothetical protein [Natrinema salaciae]|uniref:Uncharacterized protein n=1 Tax=Natrinema salaciae TaxID=1186196 RepID=A0A1H9FR45_9EURY|nr:hypothetical protein [Natrinema salaciae]SEQ40400.1 hypothetical protein SAMN04489841_1654 [Natrinema salaciae]
MPVPIREGSVPNPERILLANRDAVAGLEIDMGDNLATDATPLAAAALVLFAVVAADRSGLEDDQEESDEPSFGPAADTPLEGSDVGGDLDLEPPYADSDASGVPGSTRART